MTLHADMIAANRADHFSKHAIDELRRDVAAFLADPARARRVSDRTRGALHAALILLADDSQHVTGAWN